MLKIKNNHILCNCSSLDDARYILDNKFSHFTVRNGKAKYHYLSLADNSCGIYYAHRLLENGTTKLCRQLEPDDELKVWSIDSCL